MRRLHALLAVAGGAALAVVAALAVAVAPGWVAQGAPADPEAEWAQSGHANVDMAREEATVEARQAGAASCVRCHASQGFAAWTEQLAAGNPGNLVGPDGKAATVEYMASLGLTEEKVRPVDCEACHTETFELRIAGSTPMLPSGFEATAVGDGALCMACHNTRNGQVAWDRPDPGRYTAPHHSAQADVLMGQNVYFLPYADAYVSPHATFTGDSCVTCHMELGGGHTFQASESVCATCHGAGYTAEMVTRPVALLLEETARAIDVRFRTQFRDKVTRVGVWDPVTDETLEVDLPGSRIVSVAPTSIHGQMGLEMKLSDGTTAQAQLAQIKGADGKAVIPTSDPIVRAIWNYQLVLWDGSQGIHNPGFVRAVLTATRQALR